VPRALPGEFQAVGDAQRGVLALQVALTGAVGLSDRALGRRVHSTG
jgi:hypothetical protein